MGRVLGAFWAILAGFWGFERRPILKPKFKTSRNEREITDKGSTKGRERVEKGSGKSKLRYMDFRGPARGGI